MKTASRFFSMLLIAGLLGTSLTAFSERLLHAAPSEAQTTAMVNVNKASSEELQSVRGIGPKLAERILKFRQEKGKFEHLEDLKQVNGIGEAKFEKIKNQIAV